VNSTVDLIDDRADLFDRLSGGVVQIPVEVPFARIHRAGVTAAHGDDDIDSSSNLVGEGFGEFVTGVESSLAEYGDDHRVDLVSGFGSGREDLDPTLAIVVE
jgi:hypothetical protein